jgi:hypothetical protein
MDMATGFLQMKDLSTRQCRFPIGAFVRAPLPAEVISHVRCAEPQAADADVEIMDLHGQCLVEIEGYAFRRKPSGGDASQRQESERHEDTGADENFSLQIPSPGQLDSLQFVSAQRRTPRPGEVEIEIRAAGLNFIEVLYALGLLPDPGVLDGSAWRRRADRAWGKASRDFRRATTCLRTRLHRSPAIRPRRQRPRIGCRESELRGGGHHPSRFPDRLVCPDRTGPTARRGAVLIHAAAGGVGLAAGQIARLVGAEVLATAGTHESRSSCVAWRCPRDELAFWPLRRR